MTQGLSATARRRFLGGIVVSAATLAASRSGAAASGDGHVLGYDAAAIDRRIVLTAGTAFTAAGSALLLGGHAEAQAPANRRGALFAYVGAFTTPDRKGHGGGISVYRVDPASGVWAHEQLFEIVNPSFLTLRHGNCAV